MGQFRHVNGKARVSCKFLADQHGAVSKKTMLKGGWGGEKGWGGGSAISFHVQDSRAIEKKHIYVYMNGGGGVNLQDGRAEC